MPVYSPEQIAAALQRAGFPDEVIPIMTAVSLGESGGNSDATNSTSQEFSVGPFQINLMAHGKRISESCARDLDCASEFAYRLSDGGRNLNPWTVFTSGAWRDHLGAVKSGAGGVLDRGFAALESLAESGAGGVAGDIADYLTPVFVDSIFDKIRDEGGDVYDSTVGAAGQLASAVSYITDPDNLMKAVITLGVLAVGFAFILMGLYGVVSSSDTYQRVERAAIGAARKAATRGAA